MKTALLLLLALIVSPIASQAQVITDDPSSRIVVRPIQYDALIKQIERIKKALRQIDLNLQTPSPDLVASVPDYPAAQKTLREESVFVLTQYLNTLELILQNARRLEQENSALAALYQSQIDALGRAADQARGDERAALLQAARQQARDSETLITQNTANAINQLSSSYSSAVRTALHFKNIDQTPKRSASNYRRRLAIARILLLAANWGGNGAWILPIARQDGGGASLAFGIGYMVFQVGVPGLIIDSNDMEIDSGFNLFLYGLGSIPEQLLKNKLNGRATQAEDFVQSQSELLFQACKTAACVYRLSFDYQRFFRILGNLDSDLEIGDQQIASPIQIRYSKVKKFLRAAAKIAADQRPTAVFTPATQAPSNP